MTQHNPQSFRTQIVCTITCWTACCLTSSVGPAQGADAADDNGSFQPAIVRQQIEADWLVQAKLRLVPPSATAAIDWPVVLQQTVERGRKLAEVLQSMHSPVAADRQILEQVAQQVATYDATTQTDSWQQAYFAARWAVRRMLLNHPLLDFDSILLVKRAPTQFPHLSDQYYGWWSRPGGGVYVLRGFREEAAELRCLTSDFPPGNFLGPDLHYDADRLLVAYCKYDPAVSELPDKASKVGLPEDTFYHLYEIQLDGTSSRRLTFGRYDDFDGRYLPDERVLFLSTRKGRFLQCSTQNTELTCAADLPDSYVRCGGDDFRPVPVFTLHAMDRNGQNMMPLSAFETFEYTPALAHDGRILYCRWDYIDRFNGHFFSLWSTDQNGGSASLVYGNYTVRPQATMEPRAIPGSDKIIFTAAAHHSTTGGSLVLLDPSQGFEGLPPLTRLTPEVPFPETEQNVGHYFANPWPLSEDLYLVSWSTQPLPPHGRILDDRNPLAAQGVYLLDRWGNLELLYRDPQLSSMTPIPVRRQPRPPVHARISPHETPPQVGTFLVQNVYEGLTDIPAGAVKRLRIVGVPPKVQPQMNVPALGVSREETGKYVLGTVAVEADGSANFQLPSGVSVFFQALDADGRTLQTMRSLVYLAPGEVRGCVGCHEGRHSAPPAGSMPLALQRPPSPLTCESDGTWPLRFDRLVQPLLDQHCATCHQTGQSGARFDLTATRSYETLLQYADGDLHKLVFEKDASQAGETPSLRSKLLAYLQQDPRHCELPLTPADRQRLYTWMDTYGHTQGAFSDEQEQSLLEFKRQYAFLLTE